MHAFKRWQSGEAGHDNRLDGIAQQRVVLLRFSILVGDVLGQSEGHHKVDLVQCVAHPGGPRDVLQHGRLPLRRLNVSGVDQI